MINNLRYADDTVNIAESKNQLQQLMDTVVEESEAKGLFLNSAKSFTMVFSKSEHVTNVEVLRRANTKRKLLSEMINRQVKFFGQFMRKEEMENLVTTGYVETTRKWLKCVKYRSAYRHYCIYINKRIRW